MKLSHKDVKHIAKLARLGLTDKEIEKFSNQLSDILTYADILGEVDTEGVKPISQITDLQDVLFEDEIEDCEVSKELLAESPMDIEDNMIKVKSVF